MQALLEHLRLAAARAARSSCKRDLRRRRRGPRRHAGRAPRARSRSPGCASPRRAVEVAVPDVHVRRAPDGGLDRRAQHRDPAAGARSTTSTPQRMRQRRRGDPGLHLGVQRQRELAGAQPRAARPHDPEGGERDRPRARSEFFARGVARAQAAHPARGRRPRSDCTNSTVSRVTAANTSSCDQGCFEFRFFFSSAIQAVVGRRGLLRRGGAGADPRPRSGGTRRRRPLSDDKIVDAAERRGD